MSDPNLLDPPVPEPERTDTIMGGEVQSSTDGPASSTELATAADGRRAESLDLLRVLRGLHELRLLLLQLKQKSTAGGSRLSGL